jgi:hypothetical protein
MIVVRYADDLVIGFEHEDDARRFLDAMHERLGEFALSLHPDKTRLPIRHQPRRLWTNGESFRSGPNRLNGR